MLISHEKKKLIKDKIEKIRSKKHLIEIFKIIQNDNVNKTENNNGIFLYFNNLKDATYLKLENYLESIDNNVTETCFSATVSESNNNIIIDTDYGSKLKLSNKERSIIKKKQYDKILSENKNIIYTSFCDTDTKQKKKEKKDKKDKISIAVDSHSNDNINNNILTKKKKNYKEIFSVNPPKETTKIKQ